MNVCATAARRGSPLPSAAWSASSPTGIGSTVRRKPPSPPPTASKWRWWVPARRLTCASDLGKLGYAVTIFEAFHTAGGVLVYGIPQFRLPKEIVRHEVEGILDMGVELRLDTVIGKTITIDELFEQGYQAVFVGSGVACPCLWVSPARRSVGSTPPMNISLVSISMKAYLEEYDTPIKKKQGRGRGGRRKRPWTPPSAHRCRACMWSTAAAKREMPARNEERSTTAREGEGIEFHLLNNPDQDSLRRQGKRSRNGVYQNGAG